MAPQGAVLGTSGCSAMVPQAAVSCHLRVQCRVMVPQGAVSWHLRLPAPALEVQRSEANFPGEGGNGQKMAFLDLMTGTSQMGRTREFMESAVATDSSRSPRGQSCGKAVTAEEKPCWKAGGERPGCRGTVSERSERQGPWHSGRPLAAPHSCRHPLEALLHAACTAGAGQLELGPGRAVGVALSARCAVAQLAGASEGDCSDTSVGAYEERQSERDALSAGSRLEVCSDLGWPKGWQGPPC